MPPTSVDPAVLPVSSSSQPRTPQESPNLTSSSQQKVQKPSTTTTRPPVPVRGKSGSKGKPDKSNIKVVVRLRGPNEREKNLKSPCVVYIPEGSNKELKFINESYDKREPPSFKFDQVFGSKTSQQEFFEEVAAPLVDEVLNGFNCTLFAYGQTGTGKTHTMEGNLNLNGGDLCPDAGIIPRVLDLLFNKLEKSDHSHSVRLSMLEIYNEEVGDLLSIEKSAGKLNLNVDGTGKLQIQGQEEIIVDDLYRGISLLKSGSSRRHCSSTESNAKSSRSHCIFTVTVRIKVTLPDSPDVLKEGKLHLVDLAGSEDTRTSGAANLQAREAGAINQSLLALGRVINALAAKEESNGPMHVPYRESKLTRILQDSLGGQTKTCLIATISPCKSTLDETNNTIKYATKAMKITNTPITNLRIAPSSEIKRLKEEVTQIRALYESAIEDAKSRVTHETHNALKAQYNEREVAIGDLHEKVRQLKEELVQASNERNKALSNLETTSDTLSKAQAGLKANQLIFRHIQDRFGLSETEIEESLASLNEKVRKGERIKMELAETQVQLVEAEAVRDAYAENEIKLHAIAQDLTSRLQSRTSEAQLLQSKIERLNALEGSNRSTLVELKENASSLFFKVVAQLEDIGKQQALFSRGVETQLLEFVEEHINGGKAETAELERELLGMDSTFDLTKKEMAEANTKEFTITSRLEEGCRSMETASKAHFEELPRLVKANQSTTAETLKSFTTKMSLQRQKVTEMFEDHHSKLFLLLKEHKSIIEKLVADVRLDNQQEVAFWKTKTEQLQLSLEDHQKEQPRRLEELKLAISASIDTYSNYTKQYSDTSSHLIAEASFHTKQQGERCNAPPSLLASVYDSLKTISDSHNQHKSHLSVATKTFNDETYELTTTSSEVITQSFNQLEQQIDTFSSELSKETGDQHGMLKELQDLRRNNSEAIGANMEDLHKNFKVFGDSRKGFLARQTMSIDTYVGAIDDRVSHFNTQAQPSIDACLDTATQAHRVVQTTIPEGLKLDTPTCKTPSQLLPDDFCQHWERTNVEAVLSRFDASSSSSTSMSPVQSCITTSIL